MVRTNITREDHPHFWSFFALVAATMDSRYPSLVSLAASPDEVKTLDAQLGTWSARDFVVLAGVVHGREDPDLEDFDELLDTDVGRLIHEWLSD